jgi:CubicO group peptidase (beta-lactamase class C family)
MTALLPRSAPSELNVDAARVIRFLDAVEQAGMDFHSLMILRHGAVLAEGWWAPYRRDDIQLLYSLSKTFLAMAVGIAIGEGRFSAEDLVADLLPGLVPEPFA